MHGPKENHFPGQETSAKNSGASVGRAQAVYRRNHCPRLIEQRTTGWSSKGLSAYSRAFRFATRCRVLTRQRQRKEKQGHAMTAPSRFGRRLRGPVYGAEAPRRTRQKTDDFSQQHLRRPPYSPHGFATGRKAVFSSTGRGAFSFAKTKENGGRRSPRHQPGYFRKAGAGISRKGIPLPIPQSSPEAVGFFSPAWDSRHFRPEYRF